MKIGVDCDEILAELIAELNVYYNSTYRTNFKIEDYKTYRVEDIWGVTRERAIQIVNDFFNSEYYQKIKPVPDSQKGVLNLFEKHELILITSRPTHTKEKTHEWINKHFPKVFSDLHFTDDWPNHELGTRKAVICQDLNVDILIEDSLEKSILCANNGTKVILFNRPWNQHDNLPENITRVSGWGEVMDILK